VFIASLIRLGWRLQEACGNIKLFAQSKGFQGQLMDKVDVNGKNAIDVSRRHGRGMPSNITF